MKIDFTYTALSNNEVQYFDTDGNMVAKYPEIDFKLWCDKKLWDMTEEQVDAYLDEQSNWIRLTTEFFADMQPEPYPFGHTQGFTHIQKIK